MVAVRSDHDEHSVPVSPPSSGFETERRRDEDRRPLPAGKQAAMSGNIEQPGDRDRDNGGLLNTASGTRSDDGDDDSQAVSAVALLLLAASATSQPKLPVAFGAPGRGASVREQAFPACVDGCRDSSNLRRDHSVFLVSSLGAHSVPCVQSLCSRLTLSNPIG